MVVDFTSYVDDNTLYKVCENFDAVAETLRISAKKLSQWFKDNQIKFNTNSFHLRLSTEDSNQIKIGSSLIKDMLYEKFLGVKLDHNSGLIRTLKAFVKMQKQN